MNLSYFKAGRGNFGDDLNPYIFYRLFPSVLSNGTDDTDFYGIGTIVDSRIDQNRKAVFMGTGIRDLSLVYNKENWDVFFLRGPISSNALGFNGKKFITDSAYLLLLVDNEIQTEVCNKQYPVSVMPHYRLMDAVDWQLLSSQLGFHVIDPRMDTAAIVREICHTERLIASAMHGAIVADICRVPWRGLRMSLNPFEPTIVSEIKWNDWQLSMHLHDNPVRIHNFQFSRTEEEDVMFYSEIKSKLRKAIADPSGFQLSSDKVLYSKLNQLSAEIDRFNGKYDR